MEKSDKVVKELRETINSLEDAIDVYSKNIMGYTETLAMDTIYEEYVSFLTNIKAKLETILEIAES